MKWFDEADFSVTAGDEYIPVGQENQQTANILQAKPGEVIDTWGNENQGNSELLLGGETNFGGWVTDKERDKATYGTEKNKKRDKKFWENYRRIVKKKNSGQKLSKKEEDILSNRKGTRPNLPDTDYDDFLTSRNNYHRK